MESDMQVSSSIPVQSTLKSLQVKRTQDTAKSFDQTLAAQAPLSKDAPKTAVNPDDPSSVLSSTEKNFFNTLYGERVLGSGSPEEAYIGSSAATVLNQDEKNFFQNTFAPINAATYAKNASYVNNSVMGAGLNKRA